MSFMLFSKVIENGKLFYLNDQRNYKLAGYNLIYDTWVKRNKPLNQGWTITSGGLLQTLSEGNDFENCDEQNFALIIDFHPSSGKRIGLIEINGIHVYTYGNPQQTEWSPLMLELSIIYYDEEIENFSKEYKEEILSRVEEPKEQEKIVEFLYLNGDDYSWNWGRNGMTNAVFLHQPARDFFRQFF